MENTNFDLNKFFEDQNQINNQLIVSNQNIGMAIKSIKEDVVGSLVEQVGEMKNTILKLENTIKTIENSNKDIKEDNEKLKNQVSEMQEDTDKVTKTLLTHGTEKRQLENHIHKLIYKEISKHSIRDELFHGYLTKCCKGHITKSLGVSAFQWIEVDDIETVKRLSMKFLNKVAIHNLMRKETVRLNLQLEKTNKDNKKGVSNGKARRFELLELLIEEVGGNIDEI